MSGICSAHRGHDANCHQCTSHPVTADRVVARAVDSAFRCNVCGERCTSKRALDEHATSHPVTADVQRVLAATIREQVPAPRSFSSLDLAAALLPTVQALIADAEKRAAAAALRDAAAQDSLSTHRLTPVEVLTLRVVKVYDLWTRAAALDPSGAAERAGR